MPFGYVVMPDLNSNLPNRSKITKKTFLPEPLTETSRNEKLAAAAAAAVAFASANAGAATLTFEDTFGAFGSTTDISTDVSETVSVTGWAATAESATNTLTNVLIEVRGSLSTEGSATNNGTDADVNATILNLGAWEATTGTTVGADFLFGAAFSTPINEALGTVVTGETVNFGPFTNDSGWVTAFSGTDAALEAAAAVDYLFTTNTTSTITGSSNFASSFTTGTAGGVRVTYTFEPDSVPVPVPAPLALLLFRGQFTYLVPFARLCAGGD
jgi:hypothetical protein